MPLLDLPGLDFLVVFQIGSTGRHVPTVDMSTTLRPIDTRRVSCNWHIVLHNALDYQSAHKRRPQRC